jgi:hypothetical protein
LRDAEAPVGPDVFNQLQKRMGTKPLPAQRPVVAWWQVASAACLLLALWFLYITNSPSNKVDVSVADKQPQRKAVDREAVKSAVVIAPEQKRQKQNDKNSDEMSKTEKLLTKVMTANRKLVARTRQVVVNESTPMRLQPQSIEQIAGVQSLETKQVPKIQPAEVKPSMTIDRIVRVENGQKQPTGRTVVLTIEDPQITTSLATTQNDSPTPDLHEHKSGLPGLLGKLRQLKNGEVMAKATPAVGNQNNQKNRFGRVFSEVKESLKNETTLE